jgi:hypothetical protein
MADTSRLNEKVAQLAAKVDELVSFKNSHPDGGGDGGQSQVDALESQIDDILARIP